MGYELVQTEKQFPSENSMLLCCFYKSCNLYFPVGPRGLDSGCKVW